MKKLICLALLFALTFLLFNYKVLAKCTCTYSSGNLSGAFSVDETNSTAGNINLTGSISNSSDSSSHNINKNVSVDNWNKKQTENSFLYNSFSFIGKDYFNSTGSCPSYLYVVDWPGYYNVLVSDGMSKEIEENIKSFSPQGYEILTLHESSTCKGNSSNSGGTVSTPSPNPSACIGKTKDTCKISCTWNEKYNFCSTTGLLYTRCGDSYDIPKQAPEIISLVVTFLKILTPIILIIISIISLVKAIGASSEDEIKKAQGKVVKRFISAVMVFLVITIVQFVINKVADDSEKDSISKCLSCLLNNDCDDVSYYRVDEDTCVSYPENGDYLCPELD